MSSLEDYEERVFIDRDSNIFNLEEGLKKNFENYLESKNNIMNEVYDDHSSLVITWEFLDDDEKELYSNNSENFKIKYILLLEIELSHNLINYLEKDFNNLFPVLWKKTSTYDNYFLNMYPKIKVNIELREILSNIRRLKQYYLSDFEKKRIEEIKNSVEILKNKILKRFIHIETYMKLFYKTDFQKINSYDIRREIFSYF